MLLLLIVGAAGVIYYRSSFRPGDLEIPYVAPQPETDADAREWRVLALIIDETDVIEVPGPITSFSLARGDPQIHAVEDLAYWAGPGDVSPLVPGLFPAGRYQMILAWVKLPEGVRPGGGALTSPTMLRDRERGG